MEINESVSYFSLLLNESHRNPSVTQVRETLQKAGLAFTDSFDSQEFQFPCIWGMTVEVTWPDGEKQKFLLFLRRDGTTIEENLKNDFAASRNAFSKLKDDVSDLEGVMELGIVTDIRQDPQPLFQRQLRFIHFFREWGKILRDNNLFQLTDMRFVENIATTKTPPSLEDMFTAHIVNSSNGKTWVHTHGLARCGVPDFETQTDTEKDGENLVPLISAIASNLIDTGDGADGQDFRFQFGVWRIVPRAQANRLTRQKEWLDAEELEMHPDHLRILLKIKFLFFFNRFLSINVLAKAMANNPVVHFPYSETLRMAEMAREKLPTFEKLFREVGKDEKWSLMMKIGYRIDGAGMDDNDAREHLWFTITGMEKDSATGTLQNEPYNVAQLKVGSSYTFPLTDLTDWRVDSLELGRGFTPNDAYLIEPYRNEEIIPNYTFLQFPSVAAWKDFLARMRASLARTFPGEETIFLYGHGVVLLPKSPTFPNAAKIPLISGFAENEKFSTLDGAELDNALHDLVVENTGK